MAVSHFHTGCFLLALVAFQLLQSSTAQLRSAQIRDMALLSSGTFIKPRETVPRNEKLEIYCSWDDGSPSVTASMMDNKGARVQTATKAKTLHHVIDNVGCGDAGHWQCKAGAVEKWRTVLVECPPLPRGTPVESRNGNQTVWEFSVSSPTAMFDECLLRPQTADKRSEDQNTHSCESLDKLVSGEVPDLTLRLHPTADMLRSAQRWTLTLSNDFGTQDFNFSISDTKDTTTAASMTRRRTLTHSRTTTRKRPVITRPRTTTPKRPVITTQGPGNKMARMCCAWATVVISFTVTSLLFFRTM